MKKYIIILECKNNAFYIDLIPRIKLLKTLKRYHKGIGCRWIRKNPAVRLLFKLEYKYNKQLDHTVERWMFSRGINFVRGGSYKSALTPEQKRKLKRKIKWDRKACYTCGRLNHFSKDCKATTYVDGEDMSDIEDEYESAIQTNNGYSYSVKEVDNRPTPNMTWHSIPP